MNDNLSISEEVFPCHKFQPLKKFKLMIVVVMNFLFTILHAIVSSAAFFMNKMA